MQTKHPLVLVRRDGQPVHVSDTIDPTSGRRRPLVIDVDCLPVEERDDHAIYTIALLVVIAFPLAALWYLACVKGWL